MIDLIKNSNELEKLKINIKNDKVKLILDTNVLLDVLSNHDYHEDSSFYRKNRAKYSILLFEFMSVNHINSISNKEIFNKLDKIEKESNLKISNYITYSEVLLKILFSGCKFNFIDYDSGKEADDDLLIIAKNVKLPIITNESNNSKKKKNKKKEKTKIPAKATNMGVCCFSPENFLKKNTLLLSKEYEKYYTDNILNNFNDINYLSDKIYEDYIHNVNNSPIFNSKTFCLNDIKFRLDGIFNYYKEILT